MKVEVAQLLHMVGGLGETSYATNSSLQEKAIDEAKPIVRYCITEVYNTVQLESFVAVDLGCSSGPTAFRALSEVMEAIQELSCQSQRQPPELMFFLNDLPGNDFNTIFKFLKTYEDKVRERNGRIQVPFYVAGAPGSFYGRLFPKGSVHFMHSSYSLHFLSQVPGELVDENGAPLNRGNIYISNTSPVTVIESYLAKFQQDFSRFLKLRSNEIISGGQMVLTFLARSKADPLFGEMNHLWGLLAEALKSLVYEGKIEEEKLDAFNLPFYAPSMDEVKAVVMDEGSFEFHQLHKFELNWDPCDEYKDDFVADHIISGENTARIIRAVIEPLVASNFGNAIMDDLFTKYAVLVAQHLKKQKTKYVNITIALRKRE